MEKWNLGVLGTPCNIVQLRSAGFKFLGRRLLSRSHDMEIFPILKIFSKVEQFFSYNFTNF